MLVTMANKSMDTYLSFSVVLLIFIGIYVVLRRLEDNSSKPYAPKHPVVFEHGSIDYPFKTFVINVKPVPVDEYDDVECVKRHKSRAASQAMSK